MSNSTKLRYHQIDLTQYLIPFGCVVTFSLAGLLIQSFIVSINVIDWMKGRAMTGADKIITSIGISRIFLHLAYLVEIVALFYLSRLPEILTNLNVFTARASAVVHIWLSTLLSIFFYFKISTYRNMFFLLLKAIMSRRVVQLIVALVLLSVGYAFLFFFAKTLKFSMISGKNVTISYRQEEVISYIYTVLTVVPLLITFITSLLLIILLGFHLCKMKIHCNVVSGADPYRRTMMFTVVSFLACALNMLEHFSNLNAHFLVSLWLFVLLNFFPVLHSVLLIYVSTKLRNHFLKTIHGVHCNRKAPGIMCL